MADEEGEEEEEEEEEEGGDVSYRHNFVHEIVWLSSPGRLHSFIHSSLCYSLI
jgi:hypothetical protein